MITACFSSMLSNYSSSHVNNEKNAFTFESVNQRYFLMGLNAADQELVLGFVNSFHLWATIIPEFIFTQSDRN